MILYLSGIFSNRSDWMNLTLAPNVSAFCLAMERAPWDMSEQVVFMSGRARLIDIPIQPEPVHRSSTRMLPGEGLCEL